MDPNFRSNAARSGLHSFRDGRVQLYYETRGPSDAPEKIVLLNGAFATLKHYEQFAQSIVDQSEGRYEVLTWDYRGMGKSKVDRTKTFAGPDGKQAVEPRSQTSQMLADDAQMLIDAMWGTDAKVHVYGASMGGYVAQMLALQLIAQGRLLSLYLAVTTRGQPPALAPVMGLLGAGLYKMMMPLLVKKDPKDMVRSLLPQCFDAEYLTAKADSKDGSGTASNYDLFFDRWVSEYTEWYGFSDPEACAQQCTVVGKHRLTDAQAQAIKTSQVPVMVHIALEDALMKPKEQKELADLLGGRRTEFAGGHMGSPEGYGRFISGYVDFVKSAAPATTA